MGTVPDGDSDLATEIQWAYERQLEGAMAAWSSACAAGDCAVPALVVRTEDEGPRVSTVDDGEAPWEW